MTAPLLFLCILVRSWEVVLEMKECFESNLHDMYNPLLTKYILLVYAFFSVVFASCGDIWCCVVCVFSTP